MAPFSGVPTPSQQKALALTPKFAAILSIFGSAYIIYDCFHKRRKRITTSYHRLMVGLSVCDVLMSAGLFSTTWPMPADTPHVYGAIGTTASCEAIGAIEQFGVSATMYNGSLSIYYLLRIKYGWSPLRLSRAEIWMHVIPVVFGVATIIACLVLDSFNSGLFDCWIAPLPQGCNESWRNDGFTDCERGDNASLYQWVFDVIPKWSSVLLTTINMGIIIYTVRSQEMASIDLIASQTSKAEGDEDKPSRPKPRVAIRLARQSYLYVGALYLTYIPVIVTRSFELANGFVHYEMLLTIAIMLPLQGFWNLIVYLRPQYLRMAKEKRKKRERENQSSLVHARSNNMSFLNFVSEVVVNGGLDDEEEDYSVNSTAEEDNLSCAHNRDDENSGTKEMARNNGADEVDVSQEDQSKAEESKEEDQ